MAYPTNGKEIDRLIKIYQKSYLDILKTINVNNLYGRDNYQKAALLAQVQTQLESLDKETQLWIQTNVPKEYQAGAEKAVAGMRAIGLEPNDFTFSMLHTDAVSVIANDMYSHFAEALKTVRRDVDRTFSMVEKQEIMDKIGQGIIQGASRKEVVGQVQAVLNKQGISGLVDKGGKRWQLDTYAEMLTRTKMAETQRLGEQYSMIENGHDLVQITAHMTSCESCALAEGKVCSLTGDTPGYPTLDEVMMEATHLFGPNCRHDTVPYSPDYDEMSSIFQDLSNEKGGIPLDTLEEAGFKAGNRVE